MPVCDRCREELKTILRPMQADKLVKEYFELFKLYASDTKLIIDSELAKTRFVAGLSPENKAELNSFNRLPSLLDVVNYLSAVEEFRNIVCNSGPANN